MSIPSLPPVGGGGPSPPPPPVSPFTSSTILRDGTSAYSADIAAGNGMTIQEFSHIVLSASNEHSQINWDTQQFNASRREAFYKALALDTLALLERYLSQSQAVKDYTNLYQDNQSEVDSLNATFQSYNSTFPSSSQSAVNNVNAAIDQFNASSKGSNDYDTLNTAIATYNSTATGLNSTADNVNGAIDTFNTQATATNETIAGLNADLPADVAPFTGQTLQTQSVSHLPLLNTVTGSTPQPIPHVSYTTVTLTNATNTMNPSKIGADNILKHLTDVFKSTMQNQLAFAYALLQAQSDYVAFVQFYLQGILPSLPAAFNTPTKEPPIGGPGGGIGSGSGVSLATIMISLSNPLMAGMIGEGIYNADIRQQMQLSGDALTTQLELLSLELFAQVGLQAGGVIRDLYADRFPSLDLNSPKLAAEVGVALANEVGLTVGSGAIVGAVKAILAKAFPGLNASTLTSLASQLAAAVELTLLQAALFQLAQSVENPRLFGEVLGTLSNREVLGPQDKPASFDETGAAALKKALTDNLVLQANLSFEQADRAITQEVVSASIGDQFKQDFIVQELVQKGISEEVALNAANLAQAYVKAEILGRGLLNEKVSDARLSQTILANELVQNIVTQQPDLTNRQLRDQLAQQFITAGNTPTQAFNAATLAVVGYGVPPSNPETFRSTLFETTVGHLTALGNSPSEAQNLANRLVTTVLGPNLPGSQTSLRDLMDTRLNALLQANDTNVVAAARENLSTFLEPTVEMYSFAERLRDPANTFLLCAQTGIMYAHSQPSNYIRGVDISV